MLDPRTIANALKTAGASSEDDTERDGAFSYHAETHAAGMGISVGFVATATGQMKLIGALAGLALYGRRSGLQIGGKLVEDIRSEPHYALGGLVVGALVGLFVGYLV